MYILNTPSRIVTAKRGSWKFQDAFKKTTYVPHQCKDGHYVWKADFTSGKFAYTKQNVKAGMFNSSRGSLNNKPAQHTTDDFGNMVFVA